MLSNKKPTNLSNYGVEIPGFFAYIPCLALRQKEIYHVLKFSYTIKIENENMDYYRSLWCVAEALLS
jgi:hypothetical protein